MKKPSSPKLTNNPSWDVIVTRTTPLLSFFNSPDEHKNKTYEIQIDTSENFDSKNLLVYKDIKEKDKITDLKMKDNKPLQDKTQYWWRVRTIINNQKSHWATSRFFVDTQSDKKFMNLVRSKVKKIEVSAGYNAKNIIEYDDPGYLTFWQSPPPCRDLPWVEFDLGKPTTISRIWMLSNPTPEPNCWLKNFYWEYSNDGKKWQTIKETKIKNNNTFRNILDFDEVEARYFRLRINDFQGYAAQINEIILYSPGKPPIPKTPKQDYVLVIGNEHNGYTFTELAKHIEGLKLNLKTITVPYYEASMEMLEKLEKKPMAIVLSGNNADYPNIPMFEHNGEFEIIRNTQIPILGICAGHQFLAMAYGYTRTRSMGWSDISAQKKSEYRMTHVKITKPDPIFEGIKNNFTAPEVHSWAVAEPADEFEVIAKSTYVQAQKSTRRLIYGIQFHSEIHVPYNHAMPVISNFLKMAKKKK